MLKIVLNICNQSFVKKNHKIALNCYFILVLPLRPKHFEGHATIAESKPAVVL